MLALAQGAPMVPSNALLDRKYHCMGPEPAQVEVSSSVSIESASLPCLPRRTVVLVTGNNRTKKTLIGQQAVVKRAVGLGGWHHCVSGAPSIVSAVVQQALGSSHCCSSGRADAAAALIHTRRCCKMAQRSSCRCVFVSHAHHLLRHCQVTGFFPRCFATTSTSCIVLQHMQRNALSVLEMGPPEAIDDSPCSSADTDAREPKIGRFVFLFLFVLILAWLV
jgi:hypothetical protein